MPHQKTYTRKMRSIFNYHVASLCLLALSLASGCSIGSREVEAPTAQFTPAGWQKNEALLENESFHRYATAVKSEVRRFR